MRMVLRFFAMYTIATALATWSVAWAQTYTTVDYPARLRLP